MKGIDLTLFASLHSLSFEEREKGGILEKFFDKNNWSADERKKFFMEYFADVEKKKLPFLLGEGLGVRVCSIAKRKEEIFLPNEKDPVIFEK